MKVILAIDSFKGCLSSSEANAAARKGILAAFPETEIVEIPVSDGGEGWLEAFGSGFGGERIVLSVHDPLMRPLRAEYLRKGNLAVIESARACGLSLLEKEERDPLKATSYGLGELLSHAIDQGCGRFIVSLGGSATSDCGRGMLKALEEHFGHIPEQLDITVASDVTNPLYGPDGAAAVFGPQKGATGEMVDILDRQAEDFAREAAARHGYDRSHEPGAGAAGGLGYAFMQFLGATCKPGADLLLEAIGFDDFLSGTSLVITGEGAADKQTLMGKLPFRILQHALRHNVETLLLAGKVSDEQELFRAGFHRIECINPPDLPLETALRKDIAAARLAETAAKVLS